MTLQQLYEIKLWHVEHMHACPLESHAWDTVLTAWVLGWTGPPATLLLWWPGTALACAVLFMAPTLYVSLRRSLHRRGRLRCDWLGLLAH